MQLRSRISWLGWTLILLLAAVLLLPGIALAKTPLKKTRAEQPAAAEAQTVELFAAIEANQVSVRFVPRDDKLAHVYITNTSNQALNVQMPKAFAGTPILAQFAQQPGQVGVNLARNSAPQTLGGVQQPNGPNNPPNIFQRPGQNMFNIPIGKTHDMRASCVCLEYGKPTPNASMPYTIAKLDSVTQSPEVQPLLEQFADGAIDQPVAQLLAWHFNNHMSFDQMARLDFAPGRLSEARKLASRFSERAKIASAATTSDPQPVATRSSADAPSTK
jgi:hypothetical protein